MSNPPKANEIPLCIAIADPVRDSRIETTLTKAGYEVVAFKSAREIWENFEWRRPRYIITDRKFREEFTGLDLCRGVRERFLLPYVYIHVLGALQEAKDIDEVLDAGANDYSVKPVNPAQLRARVRVGLRWLRYIDSITQPATTAVPVTSQPVISPHVSA